MKTDKLSQMPFDVVHLYNYRELPKHPRPHYVPKDYYDKYLADYKSDEAKRMFDNIYVAYESCDCGGDYGCNHPDYPYELKFKDNETIEAVFEDDGIYLQNEFGFVKFEKLKGITMRHFVDACALIGITLVPTEYFNSLTQLEHGTK